MKGRFLKFQNLISRETRQEFITTFILALIAGSNLFFLGVVTVYFFITGDASGFPYFITVTLVAGLGWYLSERGYWRITKYFPIVIFFILGLYGSFTGVFSTYFSTFYIISFILAGLLGNEYEMLFVAVISILTHVGITRSDVHLEGIIVMVAQFTGIYLLQWVYVIVSNHIFDHSLTDPLTKLYNRGYFDATLRILRGGRQYPISIMIIDVDGLKIVNDSLGHSFGDKLLIKTAECLISACRKGDVVCRIGGDEFAIILTETNEISAKKIIKRIKEEAKLNNHENAQIQLSFSVGVATAFASEDSLREILRIADQRMYDEKNLKKRTKKQIVRA